MTYLLKIFFYDEKLAFIFTLYVGKYNRTIIEEKNKGKGQLGKYIECEISSSKPKRLK